MSSIRQEARLSVAPNVFSKMISMIWLRSSRRVQFATVTVELSRTLTLLTSVRFEQKAVLVGSHDDFELEWVMRLKGFS